MLCLTVLVVVLDGTIVNVTLPTLVTELGATTSQLQWIVDSYVLVFAGLLAAEPSISNTDAANATSSGMKIGLGSLGALPVLVWNGQNGWGSGEIMGRGASDLGAQADALGRVARKTFGIAFPILSGLSPGHPWQDVPLVPFLASAFRSLHRRQPLSTVGHPTSSSIAGSVAGAIRC